VAASVVAVSLALGVAYISKLHHVTSNENIESYQCLPKQSATMVLSTNPLLIRIDEFVTSFEAEYLISLA
jgi:hypothetical protein